MGYWSSKPWCYSPRCSAGSKTWRQADEEEKRKRMKRVDRFSKLWSQRSNVGTSSSSICFTCTYWLVPLGEPPTLAFSNHRRNHLEFTNLHKAVISSSYHTSYQFLLLTSSNKHQETPTLPILPCVPAYQQTVRLAPLLTAVFTGRPRPQPPTRRATPTPRGRPGRAMRRHFFGKHEVLWSSWFDILQYCNQHEAKSHVIWCLMFEQMRLQKPFFLLIFLFHIKESIFGMVSHDWIVRSSELVGR